MGAGWGRVRRGRVGREEKSQFLDGERDVRIWTHCRLQFLIITG